MTSLHTFCSLLLVVTMSRHRFSCRDITVRLCRLYWLLFTSRHQVSCRDISSWYCAFEQASLVVVTSAKFSCTLPLFVVVSRHQSSCRDITLLISAPSSAAYAVIPVATCCICSFNYLEVATSQQGCAHSKTASMSQLFASISASTIDCIFIHLLLHFPSFFLSSC